MDPSRILFSNILLHYYFYFYIYFMFCIYSSKYMLVVICRCMFIFFSTKVIPRSLHLLSSFPGLLFCSRSHTSILTSSKNLHQPLAKKSAQIIPSFSSPFYFLIFLSGICDNIIHSIHAYLFIVCFITAMSAFIICLAHHHVPVTKTATEHHRNWIDIC